MALIRGDGISDASNAPPVPVNQGNVPPLGGMPTDSAVAPADSTAARDAYNASERPVVATPPIPGATTTPSNPDIQRSGVTTTPMQSEEERINQQNLLLDRERTIYENAAEVKRLEALKNQPTDRDTTSSGVGTGTASTGTTTKQTVDSVAGGGGGTVAPSKGDALVQQALDSKFTWDATTDADYKLAATQLEGEVAQKMIGRGMLWSGVTQSYLQNGLISLQATYRQQAYENYKDNRNFLMQVAQMQYGREDEAWNRNMQVLKFNADREDAAFSKSMQLENQAIARANAQFNREIAAAQQAQQQAGAKLNMEANQLAANYSSYQSMLNKWKSSGRATSEIASYFGVAEGTSVTNAYALSAIARKESVFTAKQKEIQDSAYEYNQDKIYIEGLEQDYYLANPSAVDIGTKDVTQLGSSAQASNYFQALSKAQTMTSDQIYKYAADVAYNYEASRSSMGDAYTARLIQDLQAMAVKKASE